MMQTSAWISDNADRRAGDFAGSILGALGQELILLGQQS
jgi:hypothetical protein